MWKWKESRDFQFISFAFPTCLHGHLGESQAFHPLPGCQQGCANSLSARKWRRGLRAQGLGAAVAASRGITRCRVAAVQGVIGIYHPAVPPSHTHPWSPPVPLNRHPGYFLAVKWANSIQFYLYSASYNNIVSRCFTESDTQSQNPQVSTVARKNSHLTGRNLEQDLAYKEEPSCQHPENGLQCPGNTPSSWGAKVLLDVVSHDASNLCFFFPKAIFLSNWIISMAT